MRASTALMVAVGLFFSASGCGDSAPQPNGRPSAGGGTKANTGTKSTAPPASGSRSAGNTDPTPAPPPASGKKPNIVFILADDQRLDAAQCMPKVHELIAARGVTFTQNFAGTPLCCPGRSTILTGLYAHNHGVITNGDIEDEGEVDDEKLPGAVAFRKFGNDEKTFARWLKDAGYTTGYYGKYLNGYGKILDEDPGYTPPYWDEWHAFVDPEYYDYQLVDRSGSDKSKRTCYLTSRKDLPHDKKDEKRCRKNADTVVEDGKENYSTDIVADKALDFVRGAAKAGKPFLLHFAVKAPHGPFFSPERYQPDLDKAKFSDEAHKRLGNCALFDWKDRPKSFLEADMDDKPEWLQSLKGKLKEERAEHVRQKQLMSVLATEDALVRLVALLKELHIEDDTILVYTGDNGYSWGERHYIGKNCAYDECAKVPLVVLDPRHPAGGKTLDVFTMNIDFAPTFLALAGAKAAPGTRFDGQDMSALFGGDASGWSRDYLLTECWGKGTKAHPDIHAAVRSKGWKYVEHYDDSERTKVHRRLDGQQEVELYDLAKDPFELDNLALVPADRLKALGTTPEDVKKRANELAETLHKLEKQ